MDLPESALMILLVWLTMSLRPVMAISSDTIECRDSTKTNCTLYNYMGKWPDGKECTVGEVLYPRSEEELVAAVAEGVKNRRKMRVVARSSGSIPKLSCSDDLLISTRDYNKDIIVDQKAMTVTADAGVQLQTLVDTVADYNLAVTHVPMFSALSLAGALGTGSHGSGLWGKGCALHDYVNSVRLVVPASAEEGFAKILDLVEGVDDSTLDAVRVSLGVLGVISKVTLQLEALSKRSVSFQLASDSDLGAQMLMHAQKNEFGHIAWYPAVKTALYGSDNRVDVSTPGEGRVVLFNAWPVSNVQAFRLQGDTFEATEDAASVCTSSNDMMLNMLNSGFGYSNDGSSFTGFPVVGYQHRMVASGSCVNSTTPGYECPWERTIQGLGYFYHQSTFSIPLSKASAFTKDVQDLVALRPQGLCGLGLYTGINIRFLRKSRAYLGETEDAIDFGFTYYRSRDSEMPRLYEDVMEEVEQIMLFKYKGRPHWGKNRVIAYSNSASLYPDLQKFMEVKKSLDPNGLFSNSWTQMVLNDDGAASQLQQLGPFCALEGNCICSEDVHCAPASGYYCRPGLLYADARVCRKISA